MRNDKEITKYIASSLLGDGCISIDKRDYYKGGNATFEICQIIDHKDYLEWLQEKINPLTNSKLELKPSNREEKEYTFPNGITSTVKPQYRLRTARHPFFNKFRDRLYGTGRKTIDNHYFTLFDWETLAMWYMEDGYISSYNTKNRYGSEYKYSKLGLSTQGFTQAENFILKKFIKEKFNLEFNLQQNKYPSGIKYRLVAKTDNIPMFLDGISKFILPSFYYKLDYKHEKVSPNGDSCEILQDEDIV
jgi:hypothetical protein